MDFKDILKKRRAELNLTLEEIGKAVGVSKATVQRWESGVIENIRRDKIASLANVLQISPVLLVNNADEPPIDLSKLHTPTRIVLPDSDDVINIADLSEEQQKIIKDMIKVFKEGK